MHWIVANHKREGAVSVSVVGNTCWPTGARLLSRLSPLLDAWPHAITTIDKHRGLKALFDSKIARRVTPAHVEKLRDILAVLDRSREPNEINLPGFRLHSLKGTLTGFWAVSVSGNWRVTFRFDNGDAVDVDYVDYH